MAEDVDLQVAIVGAGFGGLGMGVALKDAGVQRFAIFERGDDVGGVWRENTYPGCSCDVPSHLYSFSFAPYRSRRTRYPAQTEILTYLRQVAADRGIVGHLHLRTAIAEAAYLDDVGRWELVTAAGQRVRADVVVFALGQLHRRDMPEIPGRDEFAGVSFHSAQWDHHQDLRDRDVAVIGTGSSAAQLIPQIASTARSVRVYQRTPHWVLPKPSADFGPLARAALGLPGAHRLYRRALHFGADLVLAPVMRGGWSARPVEWLARAHLRRQVPDPALRAALTPDYPIGAKRIIVDSAYYPALNRDNVELITTPIGHIAREGIVDADGVLRHADVIVYATGFRAPEFLVPMAVRGRGGRQLCEEWAQGGEAFMGLAVPGYPNAFLLAGPNSFNPAGSNPAMKESQIAYIMACLRWREEIGAPAVEVSERAMRDYRRWLTRAMAETVWGTPVPTWYRHRSGRVTNPWPASARTFDRMLRRHPAESFDVVVPADAAKPIRGVPGAVRQTASDRPARG